MNRLWIHHLLPLMLEPRRPLLAAGLVFAAIPANARADYLERVAVSPIDWLILAVGFRCSS